MMKLSLSERVAWMCLSWVACTAAAHEFIGWPTLFAMAAVAWRIGGET